MPSQKMRCYMIEEKAMSVLSRKDLTTAYNASILAQHSTAQHSTAQHSGRSMPFRRTIV